MTIDSCSSFSFDMFLKLTLEQLIRHKLNDGRKVNIFPHSIVAIYSYHFKHMYILIDSIFLHIHVDDINLSYSDLMHHDLLKQNQSPRTYDMFKAGT